MYLVFVNYVKPLEEVDRWLDNHVAFLDAHYAQGKFIFSGRRIPRTGGLILVNVETEEEVQSIISRDPFHIHQVATYEIVAFTPTKCDPRFEAFLA